MTAAIVSARTRRPLADETLTATVESFDRVGGVATAIVVGKGNNVTGQLWERVAERTPSGSISYFNKRTRSLGYSTAQRRGPFVTGELANPYRVKPFSSGVIVAGERVR